MAGQTADQVHASCGGSDGEGLTQSGLSWFTMCLPAYLPTYLATADNNNSTNTTSREAAGKVTNPSCTGDF